MIKLSTIAYIRVSTIDQNEQRQIELLKNYDIDKSFIEKASGKDKNRPQLQAMLEYIRPGDIIITESMSRLSRSTTDLQELIDLILPKKVEVKFIKEQLHLKCTAKGKLDATSQLFVSLMSSISQFERNISKERQAEGIKIAKSNGKYKGRQAIKIDEVILQKWIAKELTTKYVLETLNISRQTLYNKARQFKEQNK